MLEHIPFIGDWHRSIKLGCGEFADVWMWQHAKSKEKIVVKVHRILNGPNASKHKERCEQEADLMVNKVRHLNIVRGLNIQPDTFLIELSKMIPLTNAILITEYCDGGDLRRQLNDTRHACGMCESEVRNILQSLKNAIFYLHSLSIIVRDIKPENIVIHRANDELCIYKLTDLGCSKPIDFRTMEASLIGKMAYIAPELMTSDKYSFSVDYWSIGTVIYEVITGYRPFVPHLSLAQWILRVHEKKSDHITIYENDTGEFIYSSQIPRENQISNGFAVLLENWFKLALEWNAKQRGYIFEKSKSIDDAPIQSLKFFQTIDNILERKILTLFVLNNHMYLNYEIDNETSMDNLMAFIKRETGIPTSKCYIIKNQLNQNYDDKEFKKPIDFYIDNCYNQVMAFVMQIDGIESTTNSDIRPNKLELPFSVQSVLTNPEKRLKLHTLWKFARDTLYFVRHENRTFKTGLTGWLYFAQHLGYEIATGQQNVKQMQILIYGVQGALELYKHTLDMVGQKCNDINNWTEQYTKIAQNIERLVSACDKITIRYDSINRRIRELCQNEILLKNTQDMYDINNMIKAYDILRSQILNNNLPSKPHFELFQCAFKCFKQRETLLKNKVFVEVQRNLNCLHTEFNEIKKALEKAIIPAEKYRIELMEANKWLHDHLLAFKKMNDVETISTSTSDLTFSIDTKFNDKLIETEKIMRRHISTEDVKITKAIIEDNINLRIIMAHIMGDIDEELKLKPQQQQHNDGEKVNEI